MSRFAVVIRLLTLMSPLLSLACSAPPDAAPSAETLPGEVGPEPPARTFARYYHPESPQDVARARYDFLAAGNAYADLAPGGDSSGPSAWRNIGPFGVDNGCGAPGPFFSGRIISFAQDWNDISVLYAGAASGGIWRSEDDGSNWKPVFDDLPHPSVSAIAVVPTKVYNVWIGTGNQSNGYSGAGVPSMGMVYVSQDAGDTWVPETFTASFVRYVSKIAIYTGAGGQNIVFVATDRGLFRKDAGTWTEVFSGNVSDVVTVGTLFQPSFRVVLATRNGQIFVSEDDGGPGSFSERPLQGTVGLLGRTTLTASRIGLHDSVYASVATSAGTWAGIWRSSDAGESWQQVTVPDPGTGQMNYNNAILVHESLPKRVYTGSMARGVFVSTDGGVTWVTSSPVHEDIQALAQDVASPGTIYAANDGGLYASFDAGLNFDPFGVGTLNLVQVRNLEINTMSTAQTSGYRYFIGTQDIGMMRGPDEFLRWYEHTCCDGGDITFRNGAPFITIIGLGGGTSANRYQYATSGDTLCGSWPPFSNGLPVGEPWEAQLIWNGQAFLTNLGSGVYRTRGPATAWSRIAWLPGGTNTMAATTVGRSDAIVVGVQDAPYPVWVSNHLDGGFHRPTRDSWRGKEVTDVEVLPPIDGRVGFVMTLSGTSGFRVARSGDAGESWTDITGDLPPMVNARCVVAHPARDGEFYVGSDIGVFATTNGGINWVNYSTGLPAVPYANDLKFDAQTDEVVLGTYGRGVYVVPSISR